jgi:hypothetical protein
LHLALGDKIQIAALNDKEHTAYLQ